MVILSTALWFFMANTFLFNLSQIYLIFFSFSTCALGLLKFHVVDVKAFTSKNVCSPPKDMERFKSVKPTLTIVNRHGPCSTHPAEKLSLEQTLSSDQSRVDSIRRQISALSRKGKTSGPLSSSQITAQYGGSFGVNGYIIKVGIGTPSKSLTLVFDTGSSVTWTQCKPCKRFCYAQKDPIFDPSKSSTYTRVTCNSAPCKDVSRNSCSGSSCLYAVQYGDLSYTVGYYAEDTLTLTSDVIKNFRFGCGQNNNGTFAEVAGLFGLGPSSESFVSQTSKKYHRVFAYCLPALSSSTGYLNFGRNSDISNTNRTPITKQPNPGPYYYITITGLSVAGDTLPISSTVFSNAGTIIDSGTTITQLPPDAYQALRSAFRKHMTQYKMVPGWSTLDTCYDFTRVNNVRIPSVGVQFLNNVSLDLDPNGILVAFSRSQVCLAFASNSDPSDLGVFGNVQQKTFNVVYDIPNGEIGFSPNAC